MHNYWLTGVACTQKYSEEMGGTGILMDARHTFMNFLGVAGRGIHRFVWTCYSFAELWLLGKIVFLSLCLL